MTFSLFLLILRGFTKALTSVQVNGHKNGPLDFHILQIVTASATGQAKDPKSILSLRLFYFPVEIGFPGAALAALKLTL